MVTDARWGVNANDVLRFVISVDNPVTYNIRLEKQTLKVLVNADLANTAKGAWNIRSSIADKMVLQKENGMSVLNVDLKKQLNADNYNTFVLRQNPQNKSYRIVVDLNSSAQNTNVVVGSKPVKTGDNSNTTVSKTTTGSGSWTDRFKKDSQSNTHKLTPSERVRLSIQQAKEAAKNKQESSETTTNVPNAEVKPASNSPITQQTMQPIAVTVPKTVTGTISQGNTTASKTAAAQGTLKRTLSAKRAARSEAAAEASSKRKKDKAKSGSVEVVTKDKIEGVTIIKGSGKFRTAGGIKDKIITIDAGHGGSDPGAIGTGGAKEKNLTLPIAKNLAELLTKAGAKVHMTRTTDVDVHSAYATDRQELQARVNVAEKFSSDLFISIHINSSVNKQITGVSSYYFPKTTHDARIARCIQNRLVSVFNMGDLGIREAGFYVIKRSSMPATLLEMGFISNRKEENLMVTGSYQAKAAQAIFDGIKKYFE